jgi:hypothetical protein
MGMKRVTLAAIFDAIARRRRRSEDRERRPRKPRPLALPAARVSAIATRTADAGGAVYSDQDVADVYWILRMGFGVSLDDRLEYYREHHLRRGVAAATVEARIVSIRPFLAAALGVEDDRADTGSERPSSVGLVRRAPDRAGYGIRFSTGEVQMLTATTAVTSKQADGLISGGATLVWVDATGSATPIDVLVQEYDDRDSEVGA